MEQHKLPKDPEEQISCAFQIVQNAFNLKSKAFQEELQEEKAAHENRVINLARRCDELELLNREQNRVMDELRSELEHKEEERAREVNHLRQEIARLEKEALQFKNLRRLILESIRNHDEYELPAESGMNASASAPLCGHSRYGSLASTNLAAPAARAATTLGASHSVGCPTTRTASVRRSETLRDDNGPHSAVNPKHDGTAYSDPEGRKLFINARKRLSADAMSQLLDCVSKLNSRKLTIEEALIQVDRLCGAENAVIYTEFKDLLMKKVHSPSTGTPNSPAGEPPVGGFSYYDFAPYGSPYRGHSLKV